MMFHDEQRILTEAINEWKPKNIVSLFSGGYDSAIATHLVHRLDTHGLPLIVRSVDTNLSADGWGGYVTMVAKKFGWDFAIQDNKKGFGQFVESVRLLGCPRTRKMHTYVYQKLKERGIDAIHVALKENVHDKTLFISGMRRAESEYRRNADEYHRITKSNKIFCAPIVHWSNDQCDMYRIENDMPDNPFYGTVRGSGDCQCNWGNFITIEILKRYSPELAAGNVALIDQISRENHGYGWDGKLEGQTMLIDENFQGEAELTTPFLCQNCSRQKVRVPAHTLESRYLQAGLFDD